VIVSSGNTSAVNDLSIGGEEDDDDDAALEAMIAKELGAAKAFSFLFLVYILVSFKLQTYFIIQIHTIASCELSCFLDFNIAAVLL
jgi:hypothetical protein